MLAANSTTVRTNFKDYCDKAVDNDEAVIVTRRNGRNVVMISLEQYNRMVTRLKNAEYLQMIDRSLEQLRDGKGQIHELIEDD
jgi:antitoxin YefM